jgi:hypothetical protein
MSKNKFIILILVLCLLAACAPSSFAIQTAIAKTQAIWTPVPPLPLSQTVGAAMYHREIKNG